VDSSSRKLSAGEISWIVYTVYVHCIEHKGNSFG
jgi:exosome complex RNA-binding protein Rrp42 (RNase PH superfamily)